MVKKNSFNVTMVNPERIAKMKLPGCATKQAVVSFCVRHHVNKFWWKAQNSSKKVLLVDYQGFCDCWTQNFGSTSVKCTPGSTQYNKYGKQTTTYGSNWTGYGKTKTKQGSQIGTKFYKSNTKTKYNRAA